MSPPPKVPRTRHQVLAHIHHQRSVAEITGRTACPSGGRAARVERLPVIIREAKWAKLADRYFFLRKEGLYRFWDWGKAKWTREDVAPELVDATNRYSCVILFRKDVLELLGAIAALQYHGNRHHSLPFDEQLAHLKHGVLSLTCGPSSEFVRTLLDGLGYRTRAVQTIRVEGEWNTYNSGHVMFEFFWPEQKKWVLADVNAHRMFVKDGVYLSAGEAMEVARRGDDYEFEWLTPRGIGLVDISAGVLGEFPGYVAGEHGFASDEAVKRSLALLLPMVMLPEGGHYYFYADSPALLKRISSYAPDAIAVSRDEWWEKLYGSPPPGGNSAARAGGTTT